jgi:hypothetical protein
MSEDPRGVADVDAALPKWTQDFHRARWLAAAGVIAVLACAVIVLGVLYVQQQSRLGASCGFWRSLASLPVASAPNGRPSRLGITIVAGGRAAYAGQGCGKLPPADPSVTRWAPFYKIRVP